MNWQTIAEAIRREAAYWMALVVCPTREHWEATYRFFYRNGAELGPFDVPFVVDFEKELV
jgi:hypothetical protein